MLRDSAGYVTILLEPQVIVQGQNSWSLDGVCIFLSNKFVNCFEYGGFSSTSSTEQCCRNQLIKGVGVSLSKITLLNYTHKHRLKLILIKIKNINIITHF